MLLSFEDRCAEASESDVMALESINDRIQLLLQTMDICDEWLDIVGKGGRAVWANVLSAYAQLHLVEWPHKLRQVTTHTSSHKLHSLSSALERLYESRRPAHVLLS